MHARALLAELLGTYLLTFAVLLSVYFAMPLSTPVVAALTVGVLVYVLGPVSGAHFNPAVTVALLGVQKITLKLAGLYIVAQCVGALLAKYTLIGIEGAQQALTVQDTLRVGLGEAMGAFVLLIGICSVVFGKAKEAAAGLTIGGALLLGIFLASGMSNAALNPAVALGLGSFSLMYALGPIVGALLAAQFYRWLAHA